MNAVVIGGGAAGLSAAFRLSQKGLKVVLLERNICGGSSTGKSAGFLTPASELELSQLVRRFGPTGAKDLWEVATKGIEMITSIVGNHGIYCDWQNQDSLFVANDHSGWKAVREEAEARKQLGFPFNLLHADELPSILGSQRYLGGIRYPQTSAINPLLYAQGLKRVLLERGVELHEASEVVAVDDHTVRTHLGAVTADEIIFCADKLHPSLSPYAWNVYHAQTFLSISEPLGENEIENLFPQRHLQCWDSDLIYTYYRLTGDARLLVGGGSLLTTYSHKDVTTPHVIERVIERFKDRFPQLANVEFIQYWPGRIDMTRDLLPTVLRDRRFPWIHYVLGCVGLPWATFCGDFVARQVTKDSANTDEKYYRHFSIDRSFLIPLWLEKLLGKQITFSINNAWAEYIQVDQNS